MEMANTTTKQLTLKDLCALQAQIDEELDKYHAELVSIAKAVGNRDGDAAARIVEEHLKTEKVCSEEYKRWWHRYNILMVAAKKSATK